MTTDMDADPAQAPIIDIPAMLHQAVQHHQAGRLAEAGPLYQKILELDERHADALHLLGVVAHQIGDNEVGAELIKRAILVNSNIPFYHNNLGNILLTQGKNGEAASAYEHALALDPDNADTHMNLGNVLVVLGRIDAAIASHERVIILKPDSAEGHYNLGLALLAKGRSGDAAASFKRALDLKPDFFEAHINRGDALLNQGKTVEAAAEYERAISLKPDYIDALLNLGNTLKEQGKLDEAAGKYQRVLTLKPGYAEGHNNLGNVLFYQGKADEAAARYEQALALKPDFAEAHMNIANIHINKGELDDAAARYERALALTPDHAEARYNLSLVYFMRTPAAEWGKLCRRFMDQAQLLKKYEHELYVRLAIYHWIRGDHGNLLETLKACRMASDALGPSVERNVISMRAYANLVRRLLDCHERFPRLQKRGAGNEIALIGDSHCLSYANTILDVGGTAHKIVPHLIIGCKAWHFSKTDLNQYKRSFNSIVERLPAGTKCMMALGEIDCRASEGIIGRYKKHGGSLQDIAAAFVQNYVRNVVAAMHERRCEVSFLNVPAPNIAGLRNSAENITPQDEDMLIAVVRLFNDELAREAANSGCSIIDIYSLTADPDGKAGGAHHIDEHHLKPDALSLAFDMLKPNDVPDCDMKTA